MYMETWMLGINEATNNRANCNDKNDLSKSGEKNEVYHVNVSLLAIDTSELFLFTDNDWHENKNKMKITNTVPCGKEWLMSQIKQL